MIVTLIVINSNPHHQQTKFISHHVKNNKICTNLSLNIKNRKCVNSTHTHTH